MKKLIPYKQADAINKIGQYCTKVSAPGFDPTAVDLKAADVARITGKLTAAQAAFGDHQTSKESTKSKADAWAAAYRDLLGEFRYQSNKVRVSDAVDAVCTDLGIPRRDPTPTPRVLTQDPPEFSVASIQNGVINIRFRTAGSASPRARAENSKGVCIAVVDAANARVPGEADTVPARRVSRSPAKLDSTDMPSKVRLYACWVSDTGKTGAWSGAVNVTVQN